MWECAKCALLFNVCPRLLPQLSLSSHAISRRASFRNETHFKVVTDCRGPHLPANKLHWDTRTSPTGLPLACASRCNSGQTFPDPIAAGGRAHRPTTTAHYSENLKGGLGGCGGRWGGGQTGTGTLLWHSSPFFPSPHSCWPTSSLSTLRYVDPAWSTGSQQDQNITALPGPFPESLLGST